MTRSSQGLTYLVVSQCNKLEFGQVSRMRGRATHLVLAFMVVASSAAQASWLEYEVSQSTPSPLWLTQAPPRVGQDQAAAIARQATGGRVLGVRSSRRQGIPVHNVKILLSEGRVYVIRIDGRTGAILP